MSPTREPAEAPARVSEDIDDTVRAPSGEPVPAAARRAPHADLGRTPRTSAWPRRRVVTAAALAPAVLAVLVSVGGGWAPAQVPLWTALVALTSTGGAVVLASYLPHPGDGLRLDLGCTPCAAASALSVVAATWFLSSSPHQTSAATAAVAVVGFGLLQRLTQTGATCAT